MAAKDFSPLEVQEIIMISNLQTKVLQTLIRDKVREVLTSHASAMKVTDTRAQISGSLNTFPQLCAAIARDMIEQWIFFICMSLEEEVLLDGDLGKPLTGDDMFYAVQAQVDNSVTLAIEAGRLRALKLTSSGLDLSDVIAMLRKEKE